MKRFQFVAGWLYIDVCSLQFAGARATVWVRIGATRRSGGVSRVPIRGYNTREEESRRRAKCEKEMRVQRWGWGGKPERPGGCRGVIDQLVRVVGKWGFCALRPRRSREPDHPPAAAAAAASAAEATTSAPPLAWL